MPTGVGIAVSPTKVACLYGGGAGGGAYPPSLNYADARNSMYAFLLFLW